MMKRLVLLVLALFVAACGGSSQAAELAEPDGEWSDETYEALPACEEAYAELEPASLDELSCVMSDGTIPMAASYDCPDGRTLWWNDAGWGYLDSEPVMHEPGAERVPPEADRTACGAPW